MSLKKFSFSRSMKRDLPAFCLLLGLAGCALLDTSRAPAPMETFRDFEFARSFAGPETYIEPVPTAVLLLRKPSGNDGLAEKNEAVCKAFLKVQTPEQARDGSLVDKNIILTRMLLKTASLRQDGLEDCDYLLGQYDYGRAEALLKKLKQDETFGPFFVTFFPPELGAEGRPFLLVDASQIPANKMGQFVADWQKSLNNVAGKLSVEYDVPMPSACIALGATAKAATPLLVELALAAAVAEYPPAAVVVGWVGKDKEARVAWKQTLDDVAVATGDFTANACKGVWEWVKTKWPKKANKGG